MDSSFTRPLVCSFYLLLSSATLYLSFAYCHSKSHQILNKTLIFYPFSTTTELLRPPIFLLALKWTPKFGQKNIKFANEFCTVQDSFLLVWEKFSRCCNTKDILPKYGWIHPYFGTFPHKTFPFLICRKSFPYYCCLSSCLFLTYFAVCYVRQACARQDFYFPLYHKQRKVL